jgi:hypothetical protein
MPVLPLDYTDEQKLRSAFSWLTRAGIGRYAGSIPIGWYQAHQCAALDVLEERARAAWKGEDGPFHVRQNNGGTIEAKPVGKTAAYRVLGSVRDIFNETDCRARGI